MATLSAQVETTLNERSADRLTSNLESITSRAEQFTPTMADGGRLSDQLSDRVSTGLTEGIEESIGAASTLWDAMGRGPIGGAKLAAQKIGGESEEEEEGGGGILSTIKGNPVAASLGIIAGSTALLARRSATFGAIFDLLNTAVTLYLQPIGRIIGNQMLPFAKKGVQMAQTFNDIANGGSLSVVLPDLIEQGITSTKNAITWLRDNIGMRIWDALPSPIQTGLKALWTGAKLYFAYLKTIATNIKNFINNPVETIKTALDEISEWATTKGTEMVNYLKNDLKTDINEGISTAISAIPFVNPGGKTKEEKRNSRLAKAGAGAAAGAAVGSVVPVAGTVAGGAVGAGVGLLGGALLADGGVVTGPTNAVIGEGSESEAVLPLSNLENMLSVDREIQVETEVNLNDSEISNQLDELIRIGQKLLDQDPVEIDRSRYDASRR